ncbi:MAG: 3-methyl-2-oxobutanoate hydroxymethyltransferase [Acidobacteria bacterium RIFCSPLOWO2_02_FULL_61_28]|nr:MAG: 3-methyl-2-oxobutanoate hydroxymethyltransferase [Acidobacteria bacterium RIFCSPLOWO2_02_FULL_61_28]
MQRVTTTQLLKKKARAEKIVMIAAYDYPTAVLADEAGVDSVLVGDSLGMVVLGYETTLPVTLDDMIHHTRAVVRGAQRALVAVDLPFLTYQTGTADAVRNAGRLLQEGASAVKLEGGVDICPQVRALVSAGIPVIGHLGLTPQSIHVFGGYKLQGRDEEAAQRILSDAQALEHSGAFSIVLECIPEDLAARITASLSIPTIGIGAGVHCDGQVLVLHDLLGIAGKVKPRFVKQYARLGNVIREAMEQYAREVREGKFPGPEHSFTSEEPVTPSLTSAKKP